MQVIYNGSYKKITKPKIIKEKYNKDFGDGFYCTIIETQAIRQAKKYDTPVLNMYEYEENSNLKIKYFLVMTEEWLDFIVNSRNKVKHDYDIIIGPMVDEYIYNYVNAFFSKEITRSAFWELVKFKHPTNQIAFCTEKSIKSIKFLESKEV